LLRRLLRLLLQYACTLQLLLLLLLLLLLQ
jgi:hypothetical protein